MNNKKIDFIPYCIRNKEKRNKEFQEWRKKELNKKFKNNINHHNIINSKRTGLVEKIGKFNVFLSNMEKEKVEILKKINKLKESNNVNKRVYAKKIEKELQELNGLSVKKKKVKDIKDKIQKTTCESERMEKMKEKLKKLKNKTEEEHKLEEIKK